MNTLAAPPIPTLRIVPVDAVLPHEEHDPQRSAPLIERIRQAESWTNPPIVTPIEEDHREAAQFYALLDGANRHYAVRHLNFPHVLVQVVEYTSQHVHLETWNHVLSETSADDLLPRIYKIQGLHVEHSDVLTAQAALARREAIAYMRVLPDWVLMLIAHSTDTRSRNASLRALVNTYKTSARVNRVNHDNLHAINLLYPDAVALVVFPHYEPAEILVAARDQTFLPPGISRHIIHGRAMRLNYPISALTDPLTTLDTKNEALQRWIQNQFANKRARFYQEAMYIFDD
ncbi:MAG: hypothetical protein HC915_06575 [Anaerolineae bacterium]|nr:hypothetical protein [Anaerolineae bacterium]